MKIKLKKIKVCIGKAIFITKIKLFNIEPLNKQIL